MLSFKQYLILEEEAKKAPVSREELRELETYLDSVFGYLGIDVEFTKHFFDRINDARNKIQITVGEVSALFAKVYREYRDALKDATDGWEAVMRDVASKINIPFVLKWNPRKKEMELVGKTIMRKGSFQSSSPFLTVR